MKQLDEDLVIAIENRLEEKDAEINDIRQSYERLNKLKNEADVAACVFVVLFAVSMIVHILR
jgi:hypothetical protein